MRYLATAGKIDSLKQVFPVNNAGENVFFPFQRRALYVLFGYDLDGSDDGIGRSPKQVTGPEVSDILAELEPLAKEILKEATRKGRKSRKKALTAT